MRGRPWRLAPAFAATIAGQLSFGVTLLVALCILATGGALTYFSFRAEERQIEVLQVQGARYAAEQIDAYLDDLQRKLAYLARVRGLVEVSPETKRALLEALVRHNRAFETAAILDRDGKVAASVSPFYPAPWADMADALPFIRAFRHGEDYFGPAEGVAESHSPVMTLASPVRDSQDSVAGAIVARVSLRFLSFIVSRLEIGRTGYAYVVDHRNMLIARGNEPPERSGMQDLSGSPFIQTLAATPGGRAAVYVGLQGEEVVGALAPTRSAPWSVVVELPTAEARASLRTMLRLMLLALVAACAGAVWLGLAFSDRVADPLRRLTEAAGRIRAGDLAARVEVATPAEFGTLATAFNDMAGRLRDTIGHLEREAGERQQAERAARESEATLRAVIDNTSDVIFIKDRLGRYVLVNPALAALFGSPAAEIRGKRDGELFPPEMARELVLEDGRVMESGLPRTFEHDLAFAGTVRTFLTLKFPFTSPEGLVVGVAGIARDITDRKKVQEEIALRSAELKKAEELAMLKDHFLSTLSHEIKTPLSLVTGYAELLQDKYHDEDLVGGLLDGSQRLANHINTLLDYSALVSGRLPLYMTEVDLGEIAQNVLEGLADSFQADDLRLVSEIAPDLPPVRGDSRRLGQMLSELLENAKRFTPRGGTVGVRIAPSGGEVWMTVWDTGPGIPEADIPRIWEAFSQLDIGDAVRKGGIGLGLTIVKMLAELHGGRVEVESRGGQGCRFNVRLPASPVESPLQADILGAVRDERVGEAG